MRLSPSWVIRVTVGVVLFGVCVMSAADDWPNWRGPGHNGVTPEKGWNVNWPKDGPKVLWKASIGYGFSSFAVVGGRAYTMGNVRNTDTVYCFDAPTGKVIWKQLYECPTAKSYKGPLSTPTVHGDSVYTLSRAGHLHCYDAETGEPTWQKKPGITVPTYGLSSSPIVHDKFILLNVGTSGMAFDMKTGEKVWGKNGKCGYASPVPFTKDGKTLYLMFGATHIYGVEPDAGKEVWKFPWKTYDDMNIADPVVRGDRVFISSNYYKGSAVISLANGEPKQLWKRKDSLQNHFNPSVLHKGFLYGFSRTTLDCVDFDTGAIKWSEKGMGKGALIIADGKLVVLSQGGELIIAEPSSEKFKPISRAQVLPKARYLKAWTPPVLSAGRAFCRNDRGNVVCLDVSRQ